MYAAELPSEEEPFDNKVEREVEKLRYKLDHPRRLQVSELISN